MGTGTAGRSVALVSPPRWDGSGNVFGILAFILRSKRTEQRGKVPWALHRAGDQVDGHAAADAVGSTETARRTNSHEILPSGRKIPS